MTSTTNNILQWVMVIFGIFGIIFSILLHNSISNPEAVTIAFSMMLAIGVTLVICNKDMDRITHEALSR